MRCLSQHPTAPRHSTFSTPPTSKLPRSSKVHPEVSMAPATVVRSPCTASRTKLRIGYLQTFWPEILGSRSIVSAFHSNLEMAASTLLSSVKNLTDIGSTLL